MMIFLGVRLAFGDGRTAIWRQGAPPDPRLTASYSEYVVGYRFISRLFGRLVMLGVISRPFRKGSLLFLFAVFWSQRI